MSSLAMSSFVEQQIVLHQFTAKHSVQARIMLGWSREDLAHKAGVSVELVQQLEGDGEVDDETRLILAFRLEAEGLVFFPGFAPGWGMSARRLDNLTTESKAQDVISRLMGATALSIDPHSSLPSSV